MVIMLFATVAITTLSLLLPYPHHPFQDAHAQEEKIIRLLPGSSNRGATAYVEPSFYIVRTGDVLEFFNTDSEEHRIVVKKKSDSGDTAASANVFDTGSISPKGSSSHQFSESGLYHFECSIYSWMTGEVLATDDMLTLTKSSKYGFDVQLSWSPATPQEGEKTYFVIEFINPDGGGGAYKQHVDFVLRLENASDGSLMHRYGKHSTNGLEFDQYTFVQEGEVNAELEVYGVDFIPVAPDIMEFDRVAVVPEFHLPAIAATTGIVVVLMLLRYRPK